jgi:hypothetical protein
MLQNSEPTEISEQVAELDTGDIPATVAVSPSVRDFDNKKVVLSFEPYKQSQCEIHKLEKSEAKRLTNELKKITTTLSKHFRHQSASRIACKPINRSGQYATLFQDLPPDIEEILEIDYTSAGRIFGFLTHNIFNVVTIAKAHYK